MICDDLTPARRPMKEGEHLAKFAVSQLLDTDEHACAGERKEQSNRGAPVKKDETDEAEAGRDRVQKENSLPL